jgi:hypothetical protein
MEFVRYNDVKQDYLDSLGIADKNVLKIYTSRIIKIDEYEQQIGKDMLDWSTDDMIEYLKSARCKNVNVLNVHRKAIADFGSFLCKHYGSDDERFRSFNNEISTDVLKTLVVKDAYEKRLMTYKDYERIIENKIPGVRMYPLEQTMYLIFWHRIVERSNDIFELTMDRIDFNRNTIIRYDGTVIQLTDAETKVLKQLKTDQELGIEVKRSRNKGFSIVGVIEVDPDAQEGLRMMYTDTQSNKLIHDVYGCEYVRNGILNNAISEKPNKMRIGHSKMEDVQNNIKEKLDTEFKTSSISHSGVYYDIIKENDVTLSNFKDKVSSYTFRKYKGAASYSIEELYWILTRMKEQELYEKYENK